MTVVQCDYWQQCGITGGGCCAIGAYNRPSFGVCLKVCQQYVGPDRGAGDTIHRIAKVILGRKLARKARNCGGCAERRKALNGILPYDHTR